MTKHLLSTCMLSALSLSAMAVIITPTTYDNISFRYLSPNGEYAVSDLNGKMTIMDSHSLYSGEEKYVYGDETTSYSCGQGNSISNDGTVVGIVGDDLNAAYWKDGEWYMLDVPDLNMMNMANAITPDGARICGSVGFNAFAAEGDNLMMAPAYWDRDADGGYGECVLLPYPSLDLTGRVPQYVTAIYISEDGHTIAGQVKDGMGMLNYPIVYKQAEDGNWSYTILLEEQFKPKGELMPFPGEMPAMPVQEEYMSEEAFAEYLAAINAFYNGETTVFPEITDYMTPEELARYEADKAAYDEEYAIWWAAFEAFQQMYNEVYETAPNFVFNNVRMTPDGNTYVCTSQVRDTSDPEAWNPKTTNVPCTIKIADQTLTEYAYEGQSLLAVSVPNNDVILTATDANGVPATGYVLNIADKSYVNLYDWLAEKSDFLARWVEETLVKEVSKFDPWTGETIEGEFRYTGSAYASSDMEYIVFWNGASWDSTYSLMAWGCFINIPGTKLSVGTVSEDNAVIRFDKSGNLVSSQCLSDVKVYDMSGRLIMSADKATGMFGTPLNSGVYVVRATDTAGNTFSLKVAR